MDYSSLQYEPKTLALVYCITSRCPPVQDLKSPLEQPYCTFVCKEAKDSATELYCATSCRMSIHLKDTLCLTSFLGGSVS